MNTTLHIKLLTQDLVEKVEDLRDAGYNVPKLVRNFLTDFELDNKKISGATR